VEVAELIRSVVIEEMLHMALSSNIPISIGGAPKIDRPAFVPSYPGPLPGGLRGGLTVRLTVRLRRCSIAPIRDVFLSIEDGKPQYLREAIGLMYFGGPGGARIDAHAFRAQGRNHGRTHVPVDRSGHGIKQHG
jgi:hypothetical protein